MPVRATLKWRRWMRTQWRKENSSGQTSTCSQCADSWIFPMEILTQRVWDRAPNSAKLMCSRSDYNADFQGQTIKPELKRHGLPTRALLGEKLAYSKNRRYGYRWYRCRCRYRSQPFLSLRDLGTKARGPECSRWFTIIMKDAERNLS